MCTCKRWLNYNKDYTSLTYVSSILVVLSTALFELNTDVTTYSRFASYATTCSLRLSRCFSSLSSLAWLTSTCSLSRDVAQSDADDCG